MLRELNSSDLGRGTTEHLHGVTLRCDLLSFHADSSSLRVGGYAGSVGTACVGRPTNLRPILQCYQRSGVAQFIQAINPCLHLCPAVLDDKVMLLLGQFVAQGHLD
jgi:hypothetical protein